MFAKSVVLSDAFLDLPVRARCLYFTLGMVADDDGFVNNAKSVLRQCGSGPADLKKLTETGFLIGFDSGVVVLRHWRVHNRLQRDRYRETVYLEEKALLQLDENKLYQKGMCPECVQNGHKLDTQVREGKEREEKVSSDQDSSEEFKPPTLLEIAVYRKQRQSPVSPRRFMDYYTANGWMLGKNKMRDWKAAFRAWEEREIIDGRRQYLHKEEDVEKFDVPEHPEIAWALRTGYPSWLQEKAGEEDAEWDVP